jgi:hypothetical protein
MFGAAAAGKLFKKIHHRPLSRGMRRNEENDEIRNVEVLFVQTLLENGEICCELLFDHRA